MDTKKLDKWANLLLDTGKRNNLIHFKDGRVSTVEVLMPSPALVFDKAQSGAAFEVFEPEETQSVESSLDKKPDRDAYGALYAEKLKKNQLLLYHENVSPVSALKNIEKKARAYMEETGVGVAYMAFGFVHWKESAGGTQEYRAPLLLMPITVQNESILSACFIQAAEEDMVVNPTFQFKLESEYGTTLPDYGEEGLTSYLEKAEDIVSRLGWTISSECKIGIFSFLKMNMYQDLKDNQITILKNNTVRMLLGESCHQQNTAIESGAHHLENPLIELHTVVDADSSQLEAVELAKAGVSFVLQGPPGTGKSQTITNIIAECLYDGKKVLFVSEKQAALNVVYDKLRKAGLEAFCLALHSHKANKRDVIEELCRTLRASRTAVSDRAVQEIETKKKNQEKLDTYELELHKPRAGINRTLYQLYNAYAACRTAPDFPYVISGIETKGEAYFREASNLLEQYAAFVPSIGYRYQENPWYGYINADTSYQNREKVRGALAQITSRLDAFEKLQEKLYRAYGIDCDSLRKIVLWTNFFHLVSDSESTILTPAFFRKENCVHLLEKLQEMERLASGIKTVRAAIDTEYDREIYEMDGEAAHKKLTRLYTNRVARLFSGDYKSIVKHVRLCKKTGRKDTYESLVKLLEKLVDLQAECSQFAALEKSVRDALGSAYHGIDSDWGTLLKQVQKLRELFDRGIVLSRLAQLSREEYDKNRDLFHKISVQYSFLYKEINASRDILQQSFAHQIFDLDREPLSNARLRLKRCLDDFDHLENWCSFNSLLKKLQENALLSFVDSAIANHILAEDVTAAYQKKFYYQWIDYIWHTASVLAQFNRAEHDKAVADFCREDETQFAISRVQIKSSLSTKKPTLDLIAPGSAVSVLLREGEKKRRQKSIRKLLEETGELAQVLKPCFLMSPLSVSSFLSPDAVHFDVVIFDEASQIFPQDAIGAIYRGKQLIVVGDSRQMPPSNFFNASAGMEDSDEETGDITDFESILDLCATALPQLRLKWHYRSRFEQLITFSNRNFYEGDLVTFPSVRPDARWSGVDFYHVDGIFEHKGRTNRKEAEFIVDLIYRNIEKFPDRSLGVVAFSIAQQDLIEKLLTRRREANPSKEFYFSKNVVEPFFVKNLESVQGDERDTIILSVAYAKDAAGKLLHNFGPLNRAGGERRLNVAVTRARINVQLVSSMHYTDIDLGRTQAVGARLLREYLDYAENGSIALERTVTVDAFDQFDSEFEMEVCRFLRESGFEADTQVGCSGFRIDLGLKRPESSDYVLAIECDGAAYHSSKNARDRDRLRQQILEGMGWRFYRIWSTDWFRNNAVEKERLLKAAEEAVQADEENEETQEEGAVDFTETVEVEHFSFPTYQKADVCQIADVNQDFQAVIVEILKIEAPLNEEWLLKRIAWMFGREKVTSVVQREYETRMNGSSERGIVRRDGFLYLQNQTNYVLRVPEDEEKRDVRHIAKEELAAGLLTVIEQNVTADKESVYRYVAKELGFTRVGEAIYRCFDEALETLSPYVRVQDNLLSIISPGV